ncbi:hypothetical protein ACFIQG_00475 [Comamonas odontotermitis]
MADEEEDGREERGKGEIRRWAKKSKGLTFSPQRDKDYRQRQV